MHHVFIINPAAGRRNQTKDLLSRIKAARDRLHLNATIELTRYPGHARELASCYAKDNAVTLYACGGDGTVGEVVTGVLHSDNARISVMPIGTGNDFVKCFGRENTHRFLNIDDLVNGFEILVDALEVGERASINIVSVGLDASIAKDIARYKRLPMVSGQAAYLLSTAVNFFATVKTRCGFEVDGQRVATADYIFAVAANGRWYGGGFAASPYSDITDGKMEFIRVPAVSRLKMLQMINDYKKGRHLEKYPFIVAMQCRRLRLLSDGLLDVNLDGDIFPMRDPCIQMVPGAIRLVVPKDLALAHKVPFRA